MSCATAVCDVTDEDQVQAAFDKCASEFGGLDILVANAGIASSAPIEETTVALWRKNHDVLAEGYFLTARAAFPLLKANKSGSIVFIGSKNGVAATPGASRLCVSQGSGAASSPLSGARRGAGGHPRRTSSILTRSSAVARSGTAHGVRSAPTPMASMPVRGWKRITAIASMLKQRCPSVGCRRGRVFLRV